MNALAELQKVSGMSDARGANWTAACKKIGMNPLVVAGKWREGLSSTGAGGVQFAEVEVDTETGFITIRKIIAVQDCGLIVNKLTCESQINGGVIQGIGYALYEGRVMDRATGVMLNPNFGTYKLPNGADNAAIAQTPNCVSHSFENSSISGGKGILGSRGWTTSLRILAVRHLVATLRYTPQVGRGRSEKD